IGVDADNSDTARGVLLRHLVEPARVELDKRAIDTKEGDDDELALAPVAEAAWSAPMVAQVEIGNGAAEGNRRQQQGRQKHDGASASGYTSIAHNSAWLAARLLQCHQPPSFFWRSHP